MTNSHGLLDQEYPLKRTPETHRVAVIGDSFAAGEEIEPGSTFHEVWEKRLPDILGAPVEILNFGVSGIGTWKQLQTFHLRVPAFQPDVTVLAFYWGNDLSDALINSKKGYSNPLLDEYPVDSWFERLQVYRKRFNQGLWNQSALYQFAQTRYRILKYRIKGVFDPGYRAPGRTAEAGQPGDEQAANTAAAQKKKRKSTPRPRADSRSLFDDPYFMDSESWELGKKLILKIRDEVEAAGGKLVVVHFLAFQQYFDRWQLPTDELNAFLNRNSIAVVDPNPFFRSLSADELTALYIPNDIHLNEAGHEFLARVTLDEIAAEIEKATTR